MTREDRTQLAAKIVPDPHYWFVWMVRLEHARRLAAINGRETRERELDDAITLAQYIQWKVQASA
jgi:hypothetical protein